MYGGLEMLSLAASAVCDRAAGQSAGAGVGRTPLSVPVSSFIDICRTCEDVGGLALPISSTKVQFKTFKCFGIQPNKQAQLFPTGNYIKPRTALSANSLRTS